MDLVKHSFIGALTTAAHTLIKEAPGSFIKNIAPKVFQHLPTLGCYSFTLAPLVSGALVSWTSDYAIKYLGQCNNHLNLELEVNDPTTITQDNFVVNVYSKGYYKDTPLGIGTKMLGQWSITVISSILVIASISLIFASTVGIGCIMTSSLSLGTFIFVSKKVMQISHLIFKNRSDFTTITIKS